MFFLDRQKGELIKIHGLRMRLAVWVMRVGKSKGIFLPSIPPLIPMMITFGILDSLVFTPKNTTKICF
jgi:hypothetical protein